MVSNATAHAGKDTFIYKNQTRPDTAFLDGRGSIGALTYKWTKISGPGEPFFTAANGAITYAIGLQEGIYKFGLVVNGNASDTVVVTLRDWQKKGTMPCRPGGGKSFVISITPNTTYYSPYLNRDNILGEKIMGGDTLFFKGGTFSGFEIGDFGGSPGCPVYIMAKDAPVIIKDGFFRIAKRDTNNVQHAIIDGTTLRSKNIPYGFIMDNSHLPIGQVSHSNLVAGWVAHFTVKGYRSYNTGMLQIKLDAKEKPYGRFDKFIQRKITLTDNFFNHSTTEGLYIGHTAADGGQAGNPYGPPPRMDSVEISNNIVMNSGWDGIQLSSTRNGNIIKNNIVYKAALLNQPSQQAGIMLGGNSTGNVDSNLVINVEGSGIQVFGYGKVNVSGNVVDSIMSDDEINDGTYQSFINFRSELNAPLSIFNIGNLLSRINRTYIRVANNNRLMLPGANSDNYFVHPTETIASRLIVDNANGSNINNSVVNNFSFKLNSITTTGKGAAISITQGNATESFTNAKDIIDWLFRRLKASGSPNTLPVAHAGKDTTIALPKDSIALTSTASDADGKIVSYEWKTISAPATYAFVTSTTETFKLSNLTEGQYKFELAVTDDRGGSDKDTVMLTVLKAPRVNLKPIANAGADHTITLPKDSVLLTGSGEDKDGTVNGYRWIQLNGPSKAVIENVASATSKVSNLKNGVYRFSLVVTDNEAAIGADTVSVTVNAPPSPVNSPPLAMAGIDQIITLPLDSATLHSTSSDSDGFIASYAWKQISGPASAVITNAADSTTVIKDLKEGVFVFELKITDNTGVPAADTVRITVKPAPNKVPGCLFR